MLHLILQFKNLFKKKLLTSNNMIFFRNAINIGLMLVINHEIYDHVSTGDNIEVDFENKLIINKSNNKKFEFSMNNMSIIDEIVKHNGLINYIKEKKFNV